jgi:bacterioferritin-associated ferredoxin
MCEAVTDHDVRAAIEEGASSIAEVMACTRAGTRCGACRTEIGALVAEHAPPKSCRRRLHLVDDQDAPQPAAAELDPAAEAASPRTPAHTVASPRFRRPPQIRSRRMTIVVFRTRSFR